MLKVGLLGAGRIAAVHATAITSNEKSSLVAVADIVEGNAAKLASRYSAESRTTEEILTDSSIDAVLVATSTDTHAGFIESAVANGKAVLCEKPLDLDIERARACKKAVDSADASVMIGFNRRFDTNFSALKRSVNAGEIGSPELLSITSFDPAPPSVAYIKVSGGLYRDMMIHDFDMANFIMGDLPVTISATGTCVVEPEIGAAGDVDTAVVTMGYADGRLAVIRNSRRAVYGYDQRVELLGSEGLLQAENMLENTVVKSTVDGVESSKPTYFFLERYLASYQAEWDAFVTSVLSGKPVPVSLSDGVSALAMAEAATRSQQLGESVRLEDI